MEREKEEEHEGEGGAKGTERERERGALFSKKIYLGFDKLPKVKSHYSFVCWGDSQSWPDGEGKEREEKKERGREEKENHWLRQEEEEKERDSEQGKLLRRREGKEREKEKEALCCVFKKIYVGFDQLPKVESFSMLGRLSIVTWRWGVVKIAFIIARKEIM